MPPKEVTPIEQWQKLKEDRLNLDAELEPEYVREFFTDNLFRKTLAFLVGRASKEAKILRCTEGGVQKVASVGAGLEFNDTKSGTAPDDYGAAIQFDEVVSVIDIFIWDYPVIFKRTHDGLTYGDEFELDPGQYRFEVSTHSFNIKNKTAGLTARYQVIGWW